MLNKIFKKSKESELIEEINYLNKRIENLKTIIEEKNNIIEYFQKEKEDLTELDIIEYLMSVYDWKMNYEIIDDQLIEKDYIEFIITKTKNIEKDDLLKNFL